MGPLGLFGGSAAVQVLVDPSDLAAGETLRVAVRITGGRRNLAIEEARVRLVCENEYEWRESTTTSSDSRSSSTSGTSTTTTTTTRSDVDRQVISEQRLLEEGVVSAGTTSEHAISLAVPPDAVPSARGKITRVRWKVEATLVRRRARDVTEQVPIEVRSTADATGLVELVDEVTSHGECELAFRLEQRAFRAGEAIAGAVVLVPLAECRVNEVRVELERQEKVERGLGNEDHASEAALTVAGPLELAPGRPYECPFRLEVPQDAVPTLRTSQSAVAWRLKGIGSRRMRSDYRVIRELFIYSGPPSLEEH
jgi:SpoOM protein